MNILKAFIFLTFANAMGQNLSVAISDVTVIEGDTANFVVTLSEPSANETVLDLVTSIGYNYDDFNLLNQTIIIPAGQTTGIFSVATTEDEHGEATEYGEICPYITNPQIGYTCGTLTILDDDPNIIGEIIAQDDNLYYPQGIVVPFYNVLGNDTINGIPVTVDSVILTPLSLPNGFILSPRGQINLQGTELPGVYTIQYQLCAVSDLTNCTTATVYFTIYDPLKLDDFAFSKFVSFPNPVKNTLFIANATTINRIQISSFIGQTIVSKKVNELETTIDLSGLSNGIYFVKVTCGQAEKIVKVIKE